MSDKAHSVSQRLLNFSKRHQEEYIFVLARYGAERLLYRSGNSIPTLEFWRKPSNGPSRTAGPASRKPFPWR